MHAQFYNEAIFSLQLRPETPLLIKAGKSGEEALDPTLPDMSFVRTLRPNESEPELYIPGSSLRGVLRGHAEKLLRSVSEGAACDPTQTGRKEKREHLREACFGGKPNTEKISGPNAYNGSCYACKLFGNTALASRVRIGDMYLAAESKPLLEQRYGVAIDRVTGAVAQGPFEIEILTDATFQGRITIRNFTLGQLGLLAGSLLDLGEGLVPMGYGKSRGLGRVGLTFEKLLIRTLHKTEGELIGVGALARTQEQVDYQLPNVQDERLPVDIETTRQRYFYTLESSDKQAEALLDQVSSLWVKEVYP